MPSPPSYQIPCHEEAYLNNQELVQQRLKKNQRYKTRKIFCQKHQIVMYDSDTSENSYPQEQRKYLMYYFQKCPFLPTQERILLSNQKHS